MRERVRAAVRAGQSSRALPLLVVLLVPIPVFVVINQLQRWRVDPFSGDRWNVNFDRSWMEVFGYAQVLLAVLVLLVVSRRSREPVHVAWALVLAVVVGDDSLRWHERGGHWLTQRMDLDVVPGLLAQDVGEMLVWAGLGTVLLVLLLIAHLRSSAVAQRDSLRLTALVGLLGAFAIALDALHSVVRHVLVMEKLNVLVGVVEAGGELAALSGMLAYVVHIARRKPTVDPYDEAAATRPSRTEASARPR